MSDELDPEFEVDTSVIEVDTETLATIDGLSRIVDGINWFRAAGVPLIDTDYRVTEAYLAALGFSDLRVVAAEDREEIEQILSDRASCGDWGNAWNGAEEQVKSALAEEALEQLDAELIQVVVQQLGLRAHGAARTAANLVPVLQAPMQLLSDPDLASPADQASEDARDAACQALLVALSGVGPDHPLALKFRLFEAGRWPLGAIGGSFYVL